MEMVDNPAFDEGGEKPLAGATASGELEGNNTAVFKKDKISMDTLRFTSACLPPHHPIHVMMLPALLLDLPPSLRMMLPPPLEIDVLIGNR